MKSLWYLAIIASNSSGVFPVGSYSSLPEDISSMSFSNSGGAVRVQFHGEGSKSASSPVRAGKFKKQRRADREYVRPKGWKVVRRYPTGGRALLDAEDIEFDIYKRAREFMELSCMKMLPEQEAGQLLV